MWETKGDVMESSVAFSRDSTSTVDSKGRISVPKAIRDHLRLAAGGRVTFVPTATGVEIVPVASVPRDQVWFYSEAMRERVMEAERDVAMGRTTRVSSTEEMQRHLDSLKDPAR
ncbi:AbrB/MazE/SpoVT family DNA-binding domain-containing protein [Gemmatimonadota bacterium]